ncbi:hypothetical protein [Geodermatophilus sp. FMUSA9-8]|uniref:hypothetical protein n=1 Tax=Geodermatophilus sp. FMUSA9-8 TaxID=3120155 RepID=UPI0030093C41
MDEHPYADGCSALNRVLTRIPRLPDIVERSVYTARARTQGLAPAAAEDAMPDFVRPEIRTALIEEGVLEPWGGRKGDRNSLAFLIDPELNVSLRVLKKPTDARVPQPRSRRRSLECWQNEALFGEDVAPSRLVLNWTWHLTADGVVLQHLLLPKSHGGLTAAAGHAWRVRVPDALAGLAAGGSADHYDDDRDDLDDLFQPRDEIADDGDDDGPALA